MEIPPSSIPSQDISVVMKPPSALLLLCSALSSTSAHLIDPHHQQQQRPLTSSPEPPSHDYPPPPYRDALLAFHKALVEIPSTTGSGAEAPVASLLASHLASLGFTTELQLLPPRADVDDPSLPRYNVLAWPGNTTTATSRRPRVLLSSHLDVVPPYIPYAISNNTPITSSTLISGRGSVDAKASVVAQITALTSLLASDTAIRPEDLMLLYVVGEETDGDGMKAFSSSAWHTPLDAVIFGEPTENKLACGHKGITTGWIRAKGKAAHSGYPETGKSATEVLVRALVAVADAELGSSERFGETTFNIGRLEGGVAMNVVAKEAAAEVSMRLAAGEQGTGRDLVVRRVEEVLRGVDGEALSSEFAYGYGPVECECDVEGMSLWVVIYEGMWLGGWFANKGQVSRRLLRNMERMCRIWRGITPSISMVRVPSSWLTATMRRCGYATWRRLWRATRRLSSMHFRRSGNNRRWCGIGSSSILYTPRTSIHILSATSRSPLNTNQPSRPPPHSPQPHPHRLTHQPSRLPLPPIPLHQHSPRPLNPPHRLHRHRQRTIHPIQPLLAHDPQNRQPKARMIHIRRVPRILGKPPNPMLHLAQQEPPRRLARDELLAPEGG